MTTASTLSKLQGNTAGFTTSFNVRVVKEQGHNSYDVYVEIDGVDHYLGFAPSVNLDSQKIAGARGYKLIVMKGQFGSMSAAAEQLEWLHTDVKYDGGLTLTEVRNRAHILAGMFLASKVA